MTSVWWGLGVAYSPCRKMEWWRTGENAEAQDRVRRWGEAIGSPTVHMLGVVEEATTSAKERNGFRLLRMWPPRVGTCHQLSSLLRSSNQAREDVGFWGHRGSTRFAVSVLCRQIRALLNS